MPLFGEKRDEAAEEQASQPVIDWINSLPPADLAVELMQAFGPDGPRSGDPRSSDWVYPTAIIRWLFRGYPRPSLWSRVPQSVPVWSAILEALQLLEHAELIVNDVRGDIGHASTVTRLGLETRANGKAAVRQRIRDRTGL